MPTLRQIQRRIRSVQSTAKTTRALSLVAGSKMRRAQQMALAHRPYADALYSMLVDVLDDISAAEASAGEDNEEGLNPLLTKREVKTAGLILITSDRGLCGGLNTNLFRAGGAFITTNPDVKLVTVGRKGSDFFRRTRTQIIATFTNLGDYPAYDDVAPIAHLVADAYIKGEVDSVSIVYPRFINTVVQRPEVLRLLPAEPPEEREESK